MLEVHREWRKKFLRLVDRHALVERWARQYIWRSNVQVPFQAPVGSPSRFLPRLPRLMPELRWALTLQAGASLFAPHATWERIHLYANLRSPPAGGRAPCRQRPPADPRPLALSALGAGAGRAPPGARARGLSSRWAPVAPQMRSCGPLSGQSSDFLSDLVVVDGWVPYLTSALRVVSGVAERPCLHGGDGSPRPFPVAAIRRAHHRRRASRRWPSPRR